jgi:ubiquinone/menaquinone biosynthesis C-methylase UbiE
MSDPVNRFSNRAENYALYRPGYPAEVISVLEADCGLTKDSIIADVGSGTGLLTELFLKNGNLVYAVEPNEAMREFAERAFGSMKNFVSVDASAESSTLAERSVNFVIAAQAFHWFNLPKAKREFARILKPGGWIVLIWNERRLDSTPFLQQYEALLLRYGTDYQKVRHENITEEIATFFLPESFQLKTLENAQHFNFEALKGRLLSSSYTPEATHPNFEPMLRELESVFANNNKEGIVTIEYETRIYYGHPTYAV